MVCESVLRCVVVWCLGVVAAFAQTSSFASDVVVLPQRQAYAMGMITGVDLVAVDVDVAIEGRQAATTIVMSLSNRSTTARETEVLMPIPDGAVVRGFDFLGGADAPTATLLERHEARTLYQGIVERLRDPALLEFASSRTLRSSVFPVPANGEQKLSVTYDELLSTTPDGRVDYRLPRSDAMNTGAVAWTISVRVDGGAPVRSVYSPSHEIHVARLSPNRPVINVSRESAQTPGDFRLSFVLGGRSGPFASTFITAPDPDEPGGWFALIGDVPQASERLPREVTIVLDRSGSMAGAKMDQARDAALQIIEGLYEDEAFNIFDYSNEVASFSPVPVRKSVDTVRAARDYVRALSVDGGTNLAEALLTTLRQPATPGMLPMVLFLTDGRATVGVRDEATIRTRAAAENTHGRRVFTFGVGTDVNAPLLDQVAQSTRGTSTYVLPDEDVEVKVGEVYAKLFGPVLTGASIVARDASGAIDAYALRDITPSPLPDLYAGDELVLVGRYLRDEPMTLEVEGRTAAGVERIELPFDAAASQIADDIFVRRLWAQRRVASLIDAVRMFEVRDDADQLGEITQEIVQLSTTYGVLTEYTAFMATEGTDIGDVDALRKRVRSALASRARGTRTGRGAVSQSVNIARLRRAQRAQRTSSFLDASLSRIEVSAVQQVADLTFFKIGPRWVDTRIIRRSQVDRAAAQQIRASAGALTASESAAPEPTPPTTPMKSLRVVDFGSEGYTAAVEQLVSEGRGAVFALDGDIYVLAGDEPTILRAPR